VTSSPPRSIYSNIAWRLVLDVFSRASFIIVTVFIGRRIGVAEFGKFGYAISLVQIFYVITDLGTHLQLIKELGENRGKNEAVWRTFFDLKMALIAVCLAVFFIFSKFVWRWQEPGLFLLALLWMISNSVLDFNQCVCNGLGRMDLAKVSLATQRGFVVATSVAALIFTPTLIGIMVGVALGSVLGTAISSALLLSKLKLRFSMRFEWPEWKRILVAAIPNAVGGAFGSFYLRIGVIFLAWTWTSQAVGEYTAAFRIFETSYIIPTGIMAVAVPHLSSATRAGWEQFSRELKRMTAIMVPLALLWGGLLYMFAPVVVRTLFGANFAGTVDPLRWLAIAAGFVVLNHLVLHLMIVLNRQRRHALHETLAFIVCVLLSTIVIPRAGGAGTALALLLTEASLFVVTLIYLVRIRAGSAIIRAFP
jgi:O-antigen/teichoic acid export membrane protein